jgi:hypothetical protein
MVALSAESSFGKWINQFHNGIIRIPSNTKLMAGKVCNTIVTCRKFLMKQIHVGNIKKINKIENDLKF